MAGKIRLLTEEIIGKIAAGEVVERPAAAIKEMVENSLDAGATAVTVEIRDGGISYFRVTDNGSGIQQSDVRMAFERHATSKISSAQELAAIQTLGFRGEALASIAAVSHVTCITRTKNDTSGIKVTNSGGRIESIEETACPEGTSFTVRDLFYNTPVRLKFLKKPATEAGYVSDVMMRMILSRPDVSFRFISQGKNIYHSAGDGKLSSAVFSIYGKEIRNMHQVNGHHAGVVLKGYVSTADNGRSTRSNQSFFINGRFMKSAVLSAGVEAACRDYLPQGRYPSCVLHLTMPFELVDVNVHPNKLECRFQNDAIMAETIESIVRDALEKKSALEAPQVLKLTPEVNASATPVTVKVQTSVVPPTVNISAKAPEQQQKPVAAQQLPTRSETITTVTSPETRSNKSAEKTPAATKSEQAKPQPNKQPKENVLREPAPAVQAFMQSYRQAPPPFDAAKHNPPAQQIDLQASNQTFLPEMQKPLRIIGTAFNSYILVEYDDHLLLVDQQGVHERLLFDRMMRSLGTESCSQELMIPLILPATKREQLLLENHRDLLHGIGLSVEPFGEAEVAIRSIPMILGQPQAGDLLREVLDQLEGERGIISLEKRRAGILAIACKKAVRHGDKLREEDIRELVVRMVEKKITPASPRGAPLIIALSHSDINRRFRRPQ